MGRQSMAEGFAWTEKRERAALLVAEDQRSDRQIAAELGVGKATLERWKHAPAFRARVAELRQQLREAVLSRGVADKLQRVARMNETWQGLRRIVETRAASPELKEVPGGSTGLLAPKLRRVIVHHVAGQPPASEGTAVQRILRTERVEVVEYVLDTALLRAFLDVEKQAALELDQWGTPIERPQHAEPREQVVEYDLSRLTVEELEEFERLARKALPDPQP